MLKAQQTIGLPVLEVETGKRLGTVNDLIWEGSGMIRGIVLDAQRWYLTKRWVPMDELVAIGEDAVTVYHSDSVQVFEEGRHRLLNSGDGKLIGLPIITFSGQQIGIIVDVYFMEKMETPILGYELTDGIISDIREGRKWLPVSVGFKYGEDAVLVPANSEQNLKVPNKLGRN